MTKLVVCANVFNEMQFLPPWWKHMEPLADAFLFTDGILDGLPQPHGMHGQSLDGTVKFLKDIEGNNKVRKVTYAERPWADRAEAQNTFIPHLEDGDYVMLTAMDEFFPEEGFREVRAKIDEFEEIVPAWLHFWHNERYCLTDEKMRRMHPMGHERFFRFKEGYHYSSFHGIGHATVKTGDGVDAWGVLERCYIPSRIHHYGFCRDPFYWAAKQIRYGMVHEHKSFDEVYDSVIKSDWLFNPIPTYGVQEYKGELLRSTRSIILDSWNACWAPGDLYHPSKVELSRLL